MLSILGEKIRDNRFLRPIENMLKAGYCENWTLKPTLSGTPQGGIVSPLLANIYLDRLDQHVETTISPADNRGKAKRLNPDYVRLCKRRSLAKEKGDMATYRELGRTLSKMQTQVAYDPGFGRLKYVRYADDFILGFHGPESEAETIKGRIGDFLRDHLELELSPEKTLITPATERARFLGYEITTWGKRTSDSVDIGLRGTSGAIKLAIPAKVVVELSSPYKAKGRPKAKHDHDFDDDFTIIATYGSVYRGYVRYYKRASNLGWFGHLHWAMYWSLLRTLAEIHKTTANSMRSRYAATHMTWDELRGKFVAKRVLKMVKTDPRTGREYTALFGEPSLQRDRFALIQDGPLQRHHTGERNELVARLLANLCEVCGSDDRINVHHMRRLKDLKVPGRQVPPIWKQIMAARRRKTLIVCHPCHVAIHNGTLTNRVKALITEGKLTPTGEWAIPERDEPTTRRPSGPGKTGPHRECTYWKAVCDESRKHGLEGGGRTGSRVRSSVTTFIIRHQPR